MVGLMAVVVAGKELRAIQYLEWKLVNCSKNWLVLSLVTISFPLAIKALSWIGIAGKL